MDLIIKDDEAERLARELAGVTGESVIDAVRAALAERLAREKRVREEADRLEAVFAEMRKHYDTRPVTEEEWDWAGGDDMDKRTPGP